MISLDLNQPSLVQPTEEQMRLKLAEAVKSRNLLENSDFQWWLGKLDEITEKDYKRLVHKNEEPAAYHKRRGGIQAIELSINKLRFWASEVDNLEQRIKEQYDRSDEPVARGA